VLFNSWVFIFGFLPVTFAGYYLLRLAAMPTLAKAWLGFASLFFYAWWNFSYVFVLLFSTVANFYAAQWIASQSPGPGRKNATTVVIADNLCLLGYFKYVAFFTGVLHSAFAFPWTVAAVALPLGISFFTFQKIAYIADIHAGQSPERTRLTSCCSSASSRSLSPVRSSTTARSRGLHAPPRQHHGSDAAWRPLARGGLDFHTLGRASRHFSLDQPCLA
jgi:alginate O-acetyltransferase complex protein AlgI